MLSVKQAQSYYPFPESTTHGFDHVLRVTALAERIARAEGADMEIVRTAALLHDIAAGGPSREKHHLVGAERAREILLGMGRPAERVTAVAQCIRAHRFRTLEDVPHPPSLEAQCVFDADKLDAIGAVGVARAFAYSAELGQPLWGTVSPEFKAGRQTGEPYTAHHEFYYKLLRIRDRLYTRTGQLVAAERHGYMVDFINRMARELTGEM